MKTRSKPIINISTLFAVTLSLLGSALTYTPAYAASLVVNSLADNTTSGNSLCTLREAIDSANDAGNGDCGANSSADDTITFSVSGTILLESTLPNIVSGKGTLTIDGSGQTITISGQNAVRIFVTNSGSTVELKYLTITNGYAGGYADGGAIYNNASALTITNSTVSNSSANYGGGIYHNAGTLTINNSTISGNSTYMNNGGGLYIYSGLAATITNSTFANNTSSNYSGGIQNYGNLTITNSTFYNNISTYSYGGAIVNFNTMTVKNSTFSNNSAGIGGGIYNFAYGNLYYYNTIIANSSGGDCISTGYLAIIQANVNNIVEDGGCSAATTGDPNLAGLANNGGSTLTMKLNWGSPAIDAGDTTVCSGLSGGNKDQRGISRPIDGNNDTVAACDIGAYEASTDAAIPAVASFTATSPTNNLNIPITAFTGTDDVSGIAAYLITTTNTQPAAGDSGWSGTVPTTFTVGGEGSYSLYPWVKDGVNNVSTVASSVSVTVDLTPPSTQIDSVPDTYAGDYSDYITTGSSASFTFSSPDDGTATFECKMDTGAYSACTSAKNYTSLDEGAHTFYVRAKDPAGNVDPTPATYSFNVDTTAPDTTIDSQPNNPDNDSTPTFTFSGNDGSGSGAASYECKMDGDSYAACTSPFTSTALSESDHTFYVKAIDGVTLEDSSPAEYTWTLDLTKPTNQDTVFASSTTKQGGASITIVSSGDVTNKVWFAPAGTTTFAAGSTMTTAAGDATSILAPADEGDYQLFVMDAAGNASSASTATLTVDNTAPTNQNTVFAASAIKKGGATVTVVSSGDATNAVWFAPSGTTTFAAGSTMTTAGGTATSILAPATAGAYKLFVIDAAGNISSASTAALTVDNTPPSAITFSAKPAAYVTSTTASFSFSATDNVTAAGSLIFKCKLDAGAYATCSSPKSYSGLSAVKHTFSVYAVDQAGNQRTPTTYSWTVQKQRALNGGFNTYPTLTAMIPTSWVKSANFAATDGKDTTTKQEGTASVKIAGASAKTKTLTQTITLNGITGDKFTFTYYAKGTSFPAAGLCKGEVFLLSGGVWKLAKSIPCANSAAFKKYTATFNSTVAYTQVKIVFTYSKASGTVWFDAVSLIR